jgi:2-phospho-L-lactate/phosphoenolpyruvate guanylyltransferase
MSTFAVVPLNSRFAAKSRLRTVLSENDRAVLVHWLSRHVLSALHDSKVIAQTAVVSPDDCLLASAAASGAVPLAQQDTGLNQGLDLGRRWALDVGADALLVVLGDLPLLSAFDVRRLVHMGSQGTSQPRAILAPDRREQGTNAMLLRPPAAIPFAFGTGSLELHLGLARAAGVAVSLFRSPGTSFDVDLPADLGEVIRRRLWLPSGRLHDVPARGEVG